MSTCDICLDTGFIETITREAKPVRAPSGRDLRVGTVVRCGECNPVYIALDENELKFLRALVHGLGSDAARSIAGKLFKNEPPQVMRAAGAR